VLGQGFWRLNDVRIYSNNAPPSDRNEYLLKTSLNAEQVRESFATPETVPFWDLPLYIEIADHSGLGAAGYRLQYQKLLAMEGVELEFSPDALQELGDRLERTAHGMASSRTRPFWSRMVFCSNETQA